MPDRAKIAEGRTRIRLLFHGSRSNEQRALILEPLVANQMPILVETFGIALTPVEVSADR